MSDSIGIEQLNKLKSEFRSYLTEINPQWDETSVSTIGSDAFFALNNNVGVDFWASLTSEDALLEVSQKIRDYLISTKGSQNADQRAKGYLSSLKHLKVSLMPNIQPWLLNGVVKQLAM